MFEAQTQLEEVHRKEEDELYQQIYEDRQKHVDQLQRQMETDKISKIKRLIEFFDSKGMSQSGRDHTLKKACIYCVFNSRNDVCQSKYWTDISYKKQYENKR